VSEYDVEVERHVARLCVQRPALVLSLAATTGDGAGRGAPDLALSVFGSIPMGVHPEVARELAGRADPGAEVVEASRTEICAACGHCRAPGEIDAGCTPGYDVPR